MNTHTHHIEATNAGIISITLTIDTGNRATVWKNIPSQPLHQASDAGQIRVKATGRIIRPYLHRRGYLHIVLDKRSALPKDHAPKAVHRLVCEAFYGPCPEGYETSHADDCPTNNHISNISWQLPPEHRKDRWRQHIAKGHHRRLGHEKIDRAAIVKLNAEGASLKLMASYTGTTEKTVKHVLAEEGQTHTPCVPQPTFDRATILRLHAEGINQREIAKVLGCTQPAISHALRKNGIITRTPIDRNAILKLRLEGRTHKEIASSVGCDKNSVKRILDEMLRAGLITSEQNTIRPLIDREQIRSLAAQGLTQKELALAMGISITTVFVTLGRKTTYKKGQHRPDAIKAAA